jgi:RNA polymerase sigma-70 factor (ECF subfamily)
MLALDEGHAAPALKAGGLGLGSASADLRPERSLKTCGDTAGGAPDIRALTLAIRRGDATAFSRFYDLYSFRLYRFLLVLTGGDENEAREVCQAVLIKLAKRFQVFDDERKFWAWLCTLARNSFIDHYRARQRRNRLVPLEELPPGFGVEEDSTHRLSELLRDALAALMPEERELLQAAYVDERPLQELADASDQTYKAVESRLARLRQKLKEQMLKNLRHEHES